MANLRLALSTSSLHRADDRFLLGATDVIVVAFNGSPKGGIVMLQVTPRHKQVSANWHTIRRRFPLHRIRDRPDKAVKKVKGALKRANQVGVIRDGVVVDLTRDEQVGHLTREKHVVSSSFAPTSGNRELASPLSMDVLNVPESKAFESGHSGKAVKVVIEISRDVARSGHLKDTVKSQAEEFISNFPAIHMSRPSGSTIERDP
jgi:hypothetical protein